MCAASHCPACSLALSRFHSRTTHVPLAQHTQLTSSVVSLSFVRSLRSAASARKAKHDDNSHFSLRTHRLSFCFFLSLSLSSIEQVSRGAKFAPYGARNEHRRTAPTNTDIFSRNSRRETRRSLAKRVFPSRHACTTFAATTVATSCARSPFFLFLPHAPTHQTRELRRTPPGRGITAWQQQPV